MTGEPGETVKIGLPRAAGADSRLLILGSLPGDVSLAARQYYAHPTNQFWRLLGSAIGEELQAMDYTARIEVLAKRKIGLWDVIGSAQRRGSLDQHIGKAMHNRLDSLAEDFPELRAIAFNGAAAAAIGRRLLGIPPPGLTLVDLPSSSAANTAPFALKAGHWAVLGKFCGG